MFETELTLVKMKLAKNIKYALILLGCMWSSILMANLPQTEKQLHLFGIDNLQFPNDSLLLMNSLLIDYQVDFDIAVDKANPKDIAISLHKIGLVYYHLKEYDLATNYSWRLLNVSKKHKFSSQTMFGYALLYRISLAKEDTIRANKFYTKYLDIYNSESFAEVDDMEQYVDNMDIESSDAIAAEPISHEISDVPERIALNKLEEESSLVNTNYFLITITLVVFMLILLAWKKGLPFQRNVVIYANAVNQAKPKPEMDSFVKEIEIEYPTVCVESTNESSGKDIQEIERLKFEGASVNAKEGDSNLGESIVYESIGQINKSEVLETTSSNSKSVLGELHNNSILHFKDSKIWRHYYSGNVNTISSQDQLFFNEFVKFVKLKMAHRNGFMNGTVQISLVPSGLVMIVMLVSNIRSCTILSSNEITELESMTKHSQGFQLSCQSDSKSVMKITLKRFLQ